MGYCTLNCNEYANGVSTHSDILNYRSVVISRERARKVGKPRQTEMPEIDLANCRLCHPENLDGKPRIYEYCDGRVGMFENSAPYMPFDPQVIFMRHPDQEIAKRAMHVWKMEQIRMFDLYYIVNAIVIRGGEFAVKPIRHTDLPRMVAGFNIGPMAGQSLPHLHGQYGWEVVLDRVNLSDTEIALFYEEMRREDLLLYENNDGNPYKILAPWTPRGQYHLSLHFPKVYEIHRLTEVEMRTFAYVGHTIIKRYLELGIRNMNIVFRSSPHNREIEPVMVEFIPRVNTPALYEFLGRDVVDTPPSMIFNTFVNINFRQINSEIASYNPADEYDTAVQNAREAIENESGPSTPPPPPPGPDSLPPSGAAADEEEEGKKHKK